MCPLKEKENKEKKTMTRGDWHKLLLQIKMKKRMTMTQAWPSQLLQIKKKMTMTIYKPWKVKKNMTKGSSTPKPLVTKKKGNTRHTYLIELLYSMH